MEQCGGAAYARGDPVQYQRLGLLIMISGFLLAGGSCTRSADTMVPEWAASSAEVFREGVGKSLQAVRDATGDLSLPARVVTTSNRCTIADDGSPDCRDAAIQACMKHGYKTGKAADTATVNACRRTRPDNLQPGDDLACRTKYRLTAALCW
jgi:hypothetical protein